MCQAPERHPAAGTVHVHSIYDDAVPLPCLLGVARLDELASLILNTRESVSMWRLDAAETWIIRIAILEKFAVFRKCGVAFSLQHDDCQDEHAIANFGDAMSCFKAWS